MKEHRSSRQRLHLRGLCKREMRFLEDGGLNRLQKMTRMDLKGFPDAPHTHTHTYRRLLRSQ
jgi:hypothetical protein